MRDAMLSCPHTHSPYCDGRSKMDDMARAACDKGFVSLGFSSHARQHFDPRYSMSAQGEKEYMKTARALAEEYAGRMKIWLGMERDVFSCAERTGYDYVIGACHYLPLEGGWLTVDGDAPSLSRAIERLFGGDGLAFVQAYYKQYASYIRSYRPDIIAHFDICRKNNGKLPLFDERDPAYRGLALDALTEAFEGCRVMEINTGAIARSGALSPYPAPFMLKYWRCLGGDVILSSDCHNARDIDCAYPQALEMAKAAGFTSVLRLGTGNNLFDRCEI